MHYREFLLHARLEDNVVKEWVAAGWLVPSGDTDDKQFSDMDVARAQLISDLKGDIGVNDEGVDVILHLIDQLHGLRRSLGDLLSAVQTGPDEVRDKLAAHLSRSLSDVPSKSSR